MKLSLILLIVQGALAQCTLTGVSQTSGSAGFSITFTGMTGPSCPTSGASLGPVTINQTTGDITTPGAVHTQTIYVGEGSGQAGTIDLYAGAAPSSWPVSAFSLYAPTSIPSSYRWLLPSADGSGCIGSNGAAVPGLLAVVACSGASGGGSGALVLVEHHTVSAASEIDFPACISSTYDNYLLVLENVVTSTASQIGWQMSTNGGTSYDTGSNYDYSFQWSYGTTGGATGATSSGIYFREQNTTLAANTSYNGSVTLYNPAGALYKNINGFVDYSVSGQANALHASVGGTYKSTTPVNAFRLVPTAGTVSGSAYCYGIAKQ